MAQPEVVAPAPPARRRWAALGRLRGQPGVVVARLPAKVRTKLLVGFLAIAGLLVVVSLLGLRVLDQANARVQRLETLQRRAVVYKGIAQAASDLSQVLAVHEAGASNLTGYTGCSGSCRRAASVWAPRRHSGRRRRFAGRGRGRRADVRLRPAAGRPADLAPDSRRAFDDLTGARPREATRPAFGRRKQRTEVRGGGSDRRHQSQPAGAGARRQRERRDADAGQGKPQRVHLVPQPLHHGQWRQRRACARPWPRPLVVAGAADPEHRVEAGRDRVGGLLRPARRAEPRRAGLARAQRESDERRVTASLRRARDGESAQVGVPREHVARAEDAAERRHRFLPGIAAEAVRRAECQAGGVHRGHPLLRQPSALADQRRARPVQGGSRPDRAGACPFLAA